MSMPAAQLVWKAPELAPWSALLILLVTVVVWRLYANQLPPTRWRWALPVLRWAALAPLSLSLLKPVLIEDEADPAAMAVAVVIDQSSSMSATDPHRSPAALVALADALGRLPPGLRPRQSESLLDGVRRLQGQNRRLVRLWADVEYARLSGQASEAAQARLRAAADQMAAEASALAESAGEAAPPDWPRRLREVAELAGRVERSPLRAINTALRDAANAIMQWRQAADLALYMRNPPVRQVAAALAELTRLELVEAVLTEPDNGLLDSVPAPTPLYGFTVGKTVAPLRLRSRGGQSVRRLPLTADVERADVPAGITEIARTLGEMPLAAVVIFSDGRSLLPDPPASFKPPAPLLVVNVGTRPPREATTTAAATRPERRAVISDEERLRRLAAHGGGQYLPLESVGRLPDLIEHYRVERSVAVERPLWDSGYLFAWVVACLTAEWALRKQGGLM